MSTIDIRNTGESPVNEIIFASDGYNYTVATTLKHGGGDHFYIYDEDESDSVIIESKEQAENLIKALQKAVELNWVE